jgi:hypothetical protein
MSDLLYKWQSLIGSFLGPFLAVTFSVAGYSIIKHRERKESMRKIEVSLIQSLNDLSVAKKTIEQFLERVKAIIRKLESDMGNGKYVLMETNLPPINIYLDNDLAKIKTKSYYLHNKLLIIVASLKSINMGLKELKDNFISLSTKNEFLINIKATDREQKGTYLANLKDFYHLIEKDFIEKNIKVSNKILLQARIYNQKLRGKWGFIEKWKYEGVSFKCFNNDKDIMKINRHITSLDRIDSLLEEDVVSQIKEAEDRQKQFN